MKSFLQKSVVETTATFSLPRHPARPARLLVFLFLLGLYFSGTAAGRAQSFDWTVKNSSLAGHGSKVATSLGDDTYVTTAFTGTVTLGGATLKSNGGIDLLLIKYDSDGIVQWARRIGGPEDEQVGDVAVSFDQDYVYVTGTFRSTVKFDDYHGLTGESFASAGGTDAFVARYATASGTFKWARRAGGPQHDKGNGLALDPAGNAYTTGMFTGKAIFQAGVVPFSLNSVGLTDIFLTKYAPSGVVLFARRLGNTGIDEGRAVAVAWEGPSSGVYLTGGFAPASNPYIANVLTARFSEQGNLDWSKISGSATTIDVGNDISATPDGVYVTGDFGGQIAFGTHVLNASGGSDAFVVHYPSGKDGQAAWARRYGGNGWDEGQSIVAKPKDIYFSGTFTGTATFGHNTLTALGGAGDRDLHVTRIFPDGTPVWTRRIGSTGYDYGRGGLATYFNQSIAFTGAYGGNSITLGSKTLYGTGNLLTKLDQTGLPTAFPVYLIDAAHDIRLNSMDNNQEINYTLLGTNQLNFGVSTHPDVVGSVKLVLDGVTKFENAAPYTWAGDSPKDGGTNYHAFTPSLGNHTLSVTSFTGPNGTGTRGLTYTLSFKVTDRPVVTDLTLINAVTDASLGTLNNGKEINYLTLGTSKINIRANTNPGTVGSVKFNLDGVVKFENAAPYTWAGDSPKDGGTNYHAFTPAPGAHKLVVTPYTGPNGTGTAGKAYAVDFQIKNGGFSLTEAGRLAAGGPEPEADGASLTAAPNPFADRATLTFTATQSGPARLEVYGPTGTRTSLLFEGTVEAGKTYQYAFDGTALPPGLYVGRLTTGHRVTHRKLLLSR